MTRSHRPPYASRSPTPRTHSSSMPRFACLPTEILLEIARYCSWDDGLALALTSKALVNIGLEGVYHALNGQDGRGAYLSRRRTWSFLWTLSEYPRVAHVVRTTVRGLHLDLAGGWRVRYANDYDAHRCLGRALCHSYFDKVCVRCACVLMSVRWVLVSTCSQRTIFWFLKKSYTMDIGEVGPD